MNTRAKALLVLIVARILPVVVGLAVLVVLIAWMSGFIGRKIPPGRAAVEMARIDPSDTARFPTDVVHEVVKTYYEESVGTLKAASRTEIAARVLAPIEKIFVRAGQVVTSGEELVRLDARALETQRSQAKANLAAAEAAYRQAESAYRQRAPLRASGVITKEELDELARNVQVTLAQLDHAQQALAESEVMLSYAVIKSPKAGVIVDRLAEEGDMARPGVPLLVLYEPDSLRLEVPVAERLAVQLKVGDPVTVRIDALGREIGATIDEIVPQAEAGSRSLLIKAALPKSEGLYEGMFGRLLIPAGQRRHLCLATAAIESIGQLDFVHVVADDGRLERRFIKVGRLGMPGRVEVLSGLEAGQRVLLKTPARAAATGTGGSAGATGGSAAPSDSTTSDASAVR